MDAADNMFTAWEIRDAIGQFADGLQVDPNLIPFIQAAVEGSCLTSDRGEQQFVVDISACALFNVDTEELIWPRPPQEATIGHDLWLRALTDRELWNAAHRKFDEEYARDWTAFIWRVAAPLSRRLKFIGAWLK